MWRRAPEFLRADHENVDSGAETAESDCSRMSSSAAIELLTRRVKQQQLLLISLHLLANPGDSLLLQQTVDCLLHWLCPSLRIFHVSERACPFRAPTRLCPVAGYPSLAITFFLHEAYGEERILKVLDFFQRPPWQYHHTESCGSRTGGIHITSNGSSSNPLLRPYLLPSRDFYSLGAGMPVWGVRPVHCGGEILRITVYSSYDNYEDAVRLYETVLQRQAEEQKTGFCWFTIHTEPGLSLQLALKQLSPGVCVEPCSSAVLQFSVEEIGQLVPLLPNPCTPISTTRWQTEDLDGNKVLFQVKTPVQAQRPLTSAFPLTCLSVSTRGLQVQNFSPTAPPSWQSNRQGSRPRSDPVLEKLYREGGGAESLRSGSCCSTPPGSSCYSSQRSSPAHLSTPNHPDSPLHPSTTRYLSHLHLEEEEEEEDEEVSETNVDTGVTVCPIARSSSVDLLMTVPSERPAAVGAKSVDEIANKQIWTVPVSRTHVNPHKPSGGGDDAALENRSAAAGQGPSNRPLVENRTTAELLSARTNNQEPVEEFFI